ncbi:NAD-dependent epimerase/dehydratase family protein [Rhodobacter maris]|uniref:Nucleoside-diphosphate-sugar epimerase n=1 Tax=Rhodobacter maris TaxID=446682 RepID=A0A285RFU8_9RHOB|nr:NAD-dependent epimerase/dehydratase family protein [Rhodobacter maris]SOB92764.1 nucleoside-diphosphate-sugar epimerase [Rhodobacter maris]
MSADLEGRHLLLFGAGYCARAVAAQALARGARVSATARTDTAAARLAARGIRPWRLADGHWLPRMALAGVTDLLVSTPPASGGCPAFASVSDALAAGASLGTLRWIGYYSSSAVYGDCSGAWIDERQPPAPASPDAQGRLVAERHWRGLALRHRLTLDILRIAGIYGPEGRNILAQLRSGRARAIIKPGQVFNRIHRDDIAAATLAALRHPRPERLIHLADGAPCSSAELTRGVAALMGLPAPPEHPFDAAALPAGMAAFWAENRRLRVDAMLALPGFALRFPDWRAGYADLLQDPEAEPPPVSAATAAPAR